MFVRQRETLVNIGKNKYKYKNSWQELTKSNEKTLEITRVEDYGLARTSRSSKNKNNIESQKSKIGNIEEKAARTISLEGSTERRKTTSTPRKVKIGTNQRKDFLSPKPKCLKRLQPAARAHSPARTSMCSPRQVTSKTGKENTRTLITKWEHLAQLNMTSAVKTKPKLRDIVDSQPECLLENRK